MFQSIASKNEYVSSLRRDARVLWNLAKPALRSGSHAERLEHFYAGQAQDYDAFRQRLLHGREELFAKLTFPQNGVWVDLGAGTGENLERVGDRASQLFQMHWVDLSTSLLNIARKRAQDSEWANQIQIHEADATNLDLQDGIADVVTMSYSLTMIPDWFAAVETAQRLLKPGGQLGVVDFFVSRKYPPSDEVRHGGCTRLFWPAWFGWDNVNPSADHLPMLRRRLETTYLAQSRGSVPYLPVMRAPYYVFVGTKPISLTTETPSSPNAEQQNSCLIQD
jgi:S-adenosylmethionine-diacylgycerolhomoserine-N-methlytransferase